MSGDLDAQMTIGEVAEHLKLPQHVLRFWETRFPQVKPLKRAGGRRLYRPDDVALLGAIKDLLYGEGYTIKGVQRLLQDQGARAFAAEIPGGPGRPAEPLPSNLSTSGAGENPLPQPDRDAAVRRLTAVADGLAECARILLAARIAGR